MGPSDQTLVNVPMYIAISHLVVYAWACLKTAGRGKCCPTTTTNIVSYTIILIMGSCVYL